MSNLDGIRFSTEYELLEATLNTPDGNSYEIADIIVALEIVEDITKPFIKGSIGIQDAVGFVSQNINGGEEFILRFKTKSAPMEYEFSKTFRVYEISRREQKQAKTLYWQVEIISEEFVKNIDTKISRAFNNQYTYQIIQNILTNDLETDQDFDFEQDTDIQNYVIPYMHPFEAINFFKTRSINDNSNASFYFFENRDGFKFMSLEGLNQKTPVEFFHKPYGFSEPFARHNFVEDFFPTEMAYDNILENKKSGLEGTHGTYIELTEKRVFTQGDNRASQFIKVFSKDQDNLSRKWLESRAKNISDFESINYTFHMNGSTLRTVGDTFRFNLPAAHTDTTGFLEQDEKLDGVWIMKRIKHDIVGTVYKQHIEACKFEGNLIVTNEERPNNLTSDREEYTENVTRERGMNCNPQDLSPRGRLEIMSHEGIVIRRYRDTQGVWTIGLGVTRFAGASINPERFTGFISEDQAFDLFDEVIQQYIDGVNRAKECVDLTQEEFDALVSLAYNVGENLGPKTIEYIRDGRVVDAINLWRANPELQERRDREVTLASTGTYSGRFINVHTADEDGVLDLRPIRSIRINNGNVEDSGELIV